MRYKWFVFITNWTIKLSEGDQICLQFNLIAGILSDVQHKLHTYSNTFQIDL